MVIIEVIIENVSISFSTWNANGFTFMFRYRNHIRTKKMTSACVMTPYSLPNTDMKIIKIFLYIFTDSK